MRSFHNLGEVLLATTIILNEVSSFSFPDVSDVGVPLFSESTTGMTLLATTGSQFTNTTGQWVFPDIGNSVSTAGLEWVTQFLAVDLFPIPFTSFDDPGVSLPTPCPNFLQVGQNVTKLFLTDNDALNDNGTVFAWAFYVWNGVTTNITDASGDLVQFVPGESVTVTILVPELQAQEGLGSIKFLYDSSVVGLIEVPLSGGNLCQLSAQWAGGSPTDVQPLGFRSFFSDSMATQIDVETGVTSTLGAGSGSLTILVSGGDIIADVEFPTEFAFQIGFDPDDPTY